MAIDPRTSRILLALGAFVAGLVFFMTVVFIVTGKSPSPVAMPSAVGGPFALTDQNGKTITDKDMAGHPFLVFFGFTHCPDICPTTLAQLAGAPPAETIRRAAADLRRDRRAALERAAARLPVFLVIPLGTVFMPAFVLIAVVPLVVALATQTLGQA